MNSRFSNFPFSATFWTHEPLEVPGGVGGRLPIAKRTTADTHEG